MSDDPTPGGRGCDKCWDEAFTKMHLFGGSQMEHYVNLLKENEGKPGHD